MTFWLVFALMTAAAVFAVLWPLSRGASARAQGAATLPSIATSSTKSRATAPPA